MDFNLNIFTLNCWGIPVVSKNRSERIEAIGKYLSNSMHSIVCLQEIWSEKDYMYLKEKLKEALPYAHYFYSGVLGSGLCVFSKWLIQDVFFHQWPLNGYIHKVHHGDWFGGKGVGLCRIKYGERLINVFCTHLHAEYHADDIYLAHRVLQAYSTAEFINLTSSQADVSVLAGDLNAAPGDLSYSLISQVPALVDPFYLSCEGSNASIRKATGTSDITNNSYSDQNQVRVCPEGKRIDHILFHVNPLYEDSERKFPFAFITGSDRHIGALFGERGPVLLTEKLLYSHKLVFGNNYNKSRISFINMIEAATPLVLIILLIISIILRTRHSRFFCECKKCKPLHTSLSRRKLRIDINYFLPHIIIILILCIFFKMGRKSAISKDNLKDVICKYKEKFQASLPPISDNIYNCLRQELRTKFNCNMTEKSIQMCIKRNRNYFFHTDFSDLYQCEDESETNSFYTVNFEMSLAEYSNILPKTSIYHLSPNKWTNEIQDQIFFKTDLNCTFSFRNNYVPTDLRFNNIQCTGRCTQCDAMLSLSISPRFDCVKVACEITNYKNNYPHDPIIKNRLTTDRINKIKEQVKNNKALKVQHAMADDIMTIDTPKEPTTFPSLHKLRRLRHEIRSALHFNKNIILSLYAMAHSIPYAEFIRKISLVPFYLYFWTNDQIHIYNEALKHNYKTLSIDATGSLFQPIEPPPSNVFFKRKPRHLFLYAVVAYTPNSSVPISYMASESHTLETIATWLATWHTGQALPNEIICDDSSALLGAITKVFLKAEFNDYLKQCFDLLDKKTAEIPLCYVRLDKSHFVKKLYKQTCFNEVPEKSKLFYINCLKLLQQLFCYEEIKSVVTDIITLSLHEFRYIDLNNSQSKCEEVMERLKQKIKINENHGNVNDMRNDITDFDTETEVENHIENNDNANDIPLLKMCNDLIETEKLYIQLVEPTYKKNEYFLPDLSITLKRLLKKIPLWGNVMNSYFKSNKDASSSNVESHFKDIKTIYFDSKNQRIRLDDFLVQHHGYINGAIKLSSSNILSKIDACKRTSDIKNTKESKRAKLDNLNSENNDFELESVFQDEPIKIENWKGLAIPTPRRLKTKPIYILQNGNVANSTDNRKIITNTCAFDAVAQTFAMCYKDRKKFKDSVDEHINTGDYNDFIMLITKLSNTKHNSKEIYKLRENLLLQVFKTSNNQNVIDCACNVTKIFDEICRSSLFDSAVRQRICSNNTCSSHESKFNCKYLPLIIETITKKGINHLQEAYESYLVRDVKPECYICCRGNVSFTYDVKDIIVFELYDIYIMLNELPLNIEINNKEYNILSVIEYQPGSVPGGIGHYRAHCYRKNTNSFECYDDLYSKIQRSDKYSRIMPHILVYLFE